MRLADEVRAEALRLIRRHEMHGRVAADETRRRNRRSNINSPALALKRPSRWGLAPGFNPYLVRARSDAIGHSVRESLRSRAFRPRPPVTLVVPKPGGGERLVNIYQVADSAVSRMVFESVLSKNRTLMSGRSYAYRKDLTAHDAIHYVKAELASHQRAFVAEYDFSSFFDNISHEHIHDLLDSGRFIMTGVERSVIRSFFGVDGHSADAYSETESMPRVRGVPQGTSLSLIMANLAAWEVDRELERLGVGFVRYADDTLVWSSDYSAICAAVDSIHRCAEAMGVAVNQAKSPGVSLLLSDEARNDQGEMKSVKSVQFLGYEVGIRQTRIKPSSVEKIKRTVENLIYNNLLREPIKSTQRHYQLNGATDRDYVTLLLQIRRYLYGDLAEKEVRRYQRGEIPFRRFKGLMAAYPMLTDSDQLRQLDGWLLDTVHLALQKRYRLLTTQGFTKLPTPFGVAKHDLPRLRGISTRHHGTIDLSVPSFRRMAAVVKRSSLAHGPGGVDTVLPYGY